VQEALERQAILSTLQFKKFKKQDVVGGMTTVDPPVLVQNPHALVAPNPDSGTPNTVEARDMDVDGVPSLAIGGDTQASVSSSGVGT